MIQPPKLILPPIDRRTLIKGLGAGVTWAALSGCADASVPAPLGKFSHGVASGEPGQDRMLLWTRYASDQDTRLDVEMAETSDFASIVAGGSVTASPQNDHTAKIMVDGLQPGRTYFYRFHAPNGDQSLAGRTKTLPGEGADKFTLAVFSCANIVRGYFNAYAHANAADDFDLALHVGDYYYEYIRSTYRSRQARGVGRARNEGTKEAISLEDYRMWLSTYRQDEALQRLHQLYPMVMMWDDHESSNNAWVGGADGHDPATDGDWNLRKLAAVRAVREWLPLSDDYYTEYQVGDLATLIRPETRLIGRSKPMKMGNIGKARNRDAFWQELNDPSRTMLGMEQEQWLYGAIERSTRSGTRWQLMANQVPMDNALSTPALDWVGPEKGDKKAERKAQKVQQRARFGIPHHLDKWDGYPAARARLYEASLNADANLVVLSGDVHNAYAYNLAHQGQAVGVDIVSTSVSSAGKERKYPWIKPADMARETVAFNQHLVWQDAQYRGYTRVEVGRDEIRAEYRFTPSIKEASASLVGTHTMTVPHGARRFA